MTTLPLAITSTGMVSGVGLNAESSCAAIRCAIDNFRETRFIDQGGEWIIGSSVILDQPWRGTSKLVRMLISVMREIMEKNAQLDFAKTPVLLCLAEQDRPGRLENLDESVFEKVQELLDIRFHPQSEIIPRGRVSAIIALQKARYLLYEKSIEKIVIAATDSLLVAETISYYEDHDRLLTSQNSNGFIPGEAASAIVVEKYKATRANLNCYGIGFGVEQATVDSIDNPLRADGLVAGIGAALNEARYSMDDLAFRITDISGEQYQFKEAALALLRILRKRKEKLDIWHPADCIGEVGASIGVSLIVVLAAASHGSYVPGMKVLVHTGNDNGERSAAIMKISSTRV